MILGRRKKSVESRNRSRRLYVGDLTTGDWTPVDSSVIEPSTIDFPEPSGPFTPQYRVLAFVDDDVLVQPLEIGGEEENDFPVSVVALDGAALIARSNGAITRVTPA